MSLYPNPHPHSSCYWYEAAEKFGSPNIKWCEETLCHFISEPANTWSNIGYLLAAFFIFFHARKLKHPELTYLAPAMFIMGAMSLYYHMSNNYATQILDFVGMYVYVFWLFVLNLRKAGLLKRSKQVLVQVCLTVIGTLAIHYMYINKMKFQVIVAFAVLGILITEFMAYKRSSKKRSYKSFVIGLSFVGLAQTFSQLDVNRIWCNPSNHVIQGHALWHVLAAIGLAISYKHWEQEDYSKELI